MNVGRQNESNDKLTYGTYEITIYQKLEEIERKNYSKQKLKRVFNSITICKEWY